MKSTKISGAAQANVTPHCLVDLPCVIDIPCILELPCRIEGCIIVF